MKQQIILASLICMTSAAYAQTGPAPISNNANQFAAQAGTIAGAAQACGQNVSTLSTRTAEVVNVLTKDTALQQQAMTIFNQVLANAQTNQSQNHPIPCSTVLQTYNAMPLLRDDYKQTVIPAMAKMGTP